MSQDAYTVTLPYAKKQSGQMHNYISQITSAIVQP